MDLPAKRPVTTSFAYESTRTFTNTAGKTISTSVVSIKNTSVVLFDVRKQKEYTVPLEALSQQDQDYLEIWKGRNTPTIHPLGWKMVTIKAVEGLVFDIDGALIKKRYGSNYHHATSSTLYLPDWAIIEVNFWYEGLTLSKRIKTNGVSDITFHAKIESEPVNKTTQEVIRITTTSKTGNVTIESDNRIDKMKATTTYPDLLHRPLLEGRSATWSRWKSGILDAS